MQKLQDSVFSIIKTTNLSPAVFSFLQPTEEFTDKTPLGGILKDTKHGWLALGPKFCVVDLRSGLKVAARTFGSGMSNTRITVSSVVELPTPLTENSHQLVISLNFDDVSGMICVLHINGSQILRCIQTEVVITELAICDAVPDGPFSAFDNIVIAGTRRGEILTFDLNRASLIQALKDISQGYEHLVLNEENASKIKLLPPKTLHLIEEQRDMALENNDHLGVILNEDSLFDNQFIFRNPDGTVRMKAKRDLVRVTSLQYIPQLGSLTIGYNFGAFQLWNLLNLNLEFTSQVNVECLPVTHFGFQEPCDDPRAFCYLWVIFSEIDRFEEEEFPLAVMYSLTYQGKRMLSETKCLYQDFSSATIRFQVELSASEDVNYLLGGRCVSCHTYSISSPLGEEGEDSMLNICQLVWECWGEQSNMAAQYGMLLFDLDQWYKDQMPATYQLESNAFMSVTWLPTLGTGRLALDARLQVSSVAPYSHATRLEEHFFPNSLQYNCVCLSTSEANILGTVGVQRQIINSIDEAGPTALLSPGRLYQACVTAGLTPLYVDTYIHSYSKTVNQEEQRRFLLSVALEARLSRFLKRCAHDWATGTHSGLGCTLTFLVDWSWKRALELKENAKELAAPLFTSSTLPDKNIVRCLEHCVQQLSQLTGLLDAILTKCCNLVVPDALSEMEEKYKGIGTVSLYFQVVQWFLRVGLLPERHDAFEALPYPAHQLYNIYKKRRLKLHRLQENAPQDEDAGHRSCTLLYIDQLLEHEFGGQRIHEMWIKGGSEIGGVYPPPSLYSLLRLYLLPDIAEEHKHSLVLYLLLDYSMVYDEIRYEAVIRRLMQFPTMFGLSNTSIKATQAFWHLDHRDFDFALDQLQCLTGNTLSDWQHSVVLSSLLAQKKTQAALQYLHVRKPAPVQTAIRNKDGDIVNCSRINDHDKLDDWQTCCNLYLARGLVFEALDVIRMCVQNAGSSEDKVQVLNFFYKGCRNTGQLAKVLQVSLQQAEEEVFIKYLKDCSDPQTSDILIMYYLQQARYLEAEEYNNKLKEQRGRTKELSTSAESLADLVERSNTRETLLGAACSALPSIACRVAKTASMQLEPHVIVPKPMSVYVKANSPKNTFTYKSSFIQDTIENASETWVNKPKMRRALKRVLEIEETPFICTPKLTRSKSLLTTETTNGEGTPAKRIKFDVSGSPKTPRLGTYRTSQKLSAQMATLLDMPEVQSPGYKYNEERSGAGTPHSILKTRRIDGLERDVAPSPVDSRYLGDSDDELLETASNATHYSDSKQLRFTIPSGSDSGSSPSPVAVPVRRTPTEREPSEMREESEVHTMESPPKKLATEGKPLPRKTYKDTVYARRSLSISANSSLSDDPNASIESIADIPVTLINPRYVDKRNSLPECSMATAKETIDLEEEKEDDTSVCELRPIPQTPKGRKAIRDMSHESTPLSKRSVSRTPERVDSPLVMLQANKTTRSRSRTPEVSPRSSLAPIPEQPKQEIESEPHPIKTTLSVQRRRSRSRTPEMIERNVSESPKLEPITESPVKMSAPPSPSSPSRRSLRSRSRTPEVEIVPEQPISPRSLRSRSKTPDKLMSPKKDNVAKGRKPLSRLVLEANAFAKTKQGTDKMVHEADQSINKSESVIECTPMKVDKPKSLMDVTFSPIVNKSILQSSTESFSITEKVIQTNEVSSGTELQPLPAFTSINEVHFEKSVLHSFESSTIQSSVPEEKSKVFDTSASDVEIKSLPAFTTVNETDFDKSVLKSDESSIVVDPIPEGNNDERKTENIIPISEFKMLLEADDNKSVLESHENSVAESSQEVKSFKAEKSELKDVSSLITSDSDVETMDEQKWKFKFDSEKTARIIQKEKEKIVEIEREINEIEEDMSVGEVNSDEEFAEDEHDAESAETNEESDVENSDDDDSDSGSSNEVISIKDSDSESESNKQQLDEQPSTNVRDEREANVQSQTEKIIEMDVETCTEKEIEGTIEKASEINDEKTINVTQVQPIQSISDIKNIIESKDMEVSADFLNQANISLLTDDNSTINSDINLTYSDEVQNNEDIKESQAEDLESVTPPIQVEVIVEQIATNDEYKPEKSTTDTKDGDVVDSTGTAQAPLNKNATQEKNLEDNKEDKSTEKEPKVSRMSRKRTKSTSDYITQEAVVTGIIEENTESTTSRNRSRSRSSNKSTTITVENSEEDPKPEKKTPSRRSKTPNRESRIILTRRASKELAEKGEEVETLYLDESLTPRRRSSRFRSKNLDDNASVASESSIKSSQSKASVDSENVKPAVRKGRKSILNTKTDLSAIPEAPVEDNLMKNEINKVINEYSTGRRLTRNQKSILENLLTPTTLRRRDSVASKSEASVDDDDAQSETNTIDRVELLDKEDFEGQPDLEEFHRASPVSHVSDPVTPRPRLARAASETKTITKPSKVTRRTSIDITAIPEEDSADQASPLRSRRASFNRACELLTPKGRRTSTDVKKSDTDSVASSVTTRASTPKRKTRRASTQSDTTPPSESGRRTRKTTDKTNE
ncbi:protein ELYS isoform X2 [Battus philenor]|uniref:protein ELYS isoform X2 n=1 Tax=Battus philenor TaxID=42288 RepID=UPI0035CFC2C9